MCKEAIKEMFSELSDQHLCQVTVNKAILKNCNEWL